MVSLMRRTIGSALALVIGIAAVQGCSGPDSSETDRPAGGSDTKRLTNVAIETVHPGSLEEYLDLTGYTEALNDVIIASELGGTVQELTVDRGDRVKKGQVLAKVSADIYKAQLAEARARLRLKEAELEKAKALFEKSSITAMQKLQAQEEYDVASAQTAMAESRLRRAVIRAPFPGIIDDRYVEPGELVGPGGRLLRLVDRSGIKITSDLSELDVSSLNPGITGQVTFDAFPGDTFQAELTFVASSSDPASRSFPCEFRLSGTAGEVVRSGMIARIHILKELHKSVLVLPQTTIVETETGSTVFIVNGDTAHRKEVILGASNDGMVIVKDGLESGQTVVVTGHRDLVDGQQVRVTTRKD